MKKYLILLFMAIFFVGCGTKEPLPPIANAFKFNAIDFTHIQGHYPKKFKYQSPQEVEKKYNEQILEALKSNNLLDQNSSDELKIVIEHQREFVGEATPVKSDRMGNIWLNYKIQIVRNNEILRQYTGIRERYDPGFFGNLKTIAMLNTDDTLENDAISAMVKHIIDIIKEKF